VNALVADVTAITGPEESVVLVCGDVEGGEPLLSALVARGSLILASGTTTVDPTNVEVSGAEVRLLVLARHDAGTTGCAVRTMSAGDVAYAVGSRAARLSEVAGGPLPALARLSRRVRGFELTYADPDVAAREVLRLWAQS
jgi:hypothetical protein